MKLNSELPWQRITPDGYGKLDLQLVIGSDFGTLAIKRNRPDAARLPGNFVVYHNDNPISDETHVQRPDAQAEAERYLYSHPRFSGSSAAIVIASKVESGRQAFRDGNSIFNCPFPSSAAEDRNHWANGWLQAFGAGVAAQAINATVATAQANALLENDLKTMVANVQHLRAVLDYALHLTSTMDPTQPRNFLNDAQTMDAEQLRERYPEIALDAPS